MKVFIGLLLYLLSWAVMAQCDMRSQQTLCFAGSNTIGATLIPELISSFIGSQWSDVAENEREIIVGSGNIPQKIFLTSHGSSTGFTALKTQQTHIAMSSRKIKQDEYNPLAIFANMTSKDSEHVLALDGLAIIVHPDNPINSLTITDIAKIFAGKTINWNQSTDFNGQITLYARDDKSGTYDTFKNLVLHPNNLKLSRNATRYESNADLVAAVNKDKNAIGFTSIAYAQQSKIVSIDECGILYSPNAFSIKTEEYPLMRRLYLYTYLFNKHPHTKNFIDFAMSEKGQNIVEQAGFINLSPLSSQYEFGKSQSLEEFNTLLKQERSFANSMILNSQVATELADYIAKRSNNFRLSVTFRFHKGTFMLDNKAEADIKRLIEYLQQLKRDHIKLILFGFADNVGTYEENKRLSVKRAETVASAIRTALKEYPDLQVDFTTEGYGEEVPVACNNTEAGKERNRRVEVWIK
jgi:phosphate transport system substrate-binding protein